MFWPFNKKSEDALELLYGANSMSSNSGGAGMGQSAAGQAGGMIQSSGAGSFAAGYTHSQLHQMISTLIVGLSKEEQVELENLQKDHEVKIKQAKLTLFKAIHSDMRQLVINAYEWIDCHETMNNTGAPKDPRLEELEKKDSNGKIFMTNGSGHVSVNTGWYPTPTGIVGNLPLPAGITLEDLKQAHMEATLEEEMLNNGTTDS